MDGSGAGNERVEHNGDEVVEEDEWGARGGWRVGKDD
jgi:hypothetical protein